MLAIKIDNPEIANKFKEYARKQKKSVEDVVSEAMKLFLDLHRKDDELSFTKKDFRFIDGLELINEQK